MSKLRKIVRRTLFSRRRDDGIELGREEKSKLYSGAGDKVCIKVTHNTIPEILLLLLLC